MMSPDPTPIQPATPTPAPAAGAPITPAAVPETPAAPPAPPVASAPPPPASPADLPPAAPPAELATEHSTLPPPAEPVPAASPAPPPPASEPPVPRMYFAPAPQADATSAAGQVAPAPSAPPPPDAAAESVAPASPPDATSAASQAAPTEPLAPAEPAVSAAPAEPPRDPSLPPPPNTYLGARGFPQATYSLATWHKVAGALVILGLIVALCLAGPRATLFWVNVTFTVFFLTSSLYRFLLIDLSLHSHEQIAVVPTELEEPPGGWPRYVIQVPLYKERRALPHLIKSLSALDYPKDKLTIQLLIEADDTETQAGLREITLIPPFTVVSIPVSHPRTKPKACNVGLAYAEGEFLVIYDAEDRPEADQLKKAVIAFGRCAPNVACIQAKLNFYNTDRNLMTRCFTAEYAMWFDLCLPGLDHLRAPIPLGGTSNHFRLDVLKQLKGWDEFNVTEDCDLGLRLFVAGWRTRMLDSTTWEEACPKPLAWLRQRSRWAKGYVQTYLVHTRDLLGVTRRLGIAHSLHFHLLLGGSILSQLLSPFYWFMVVVWLIFHTRLHDLGIDTFYPGPVFLMAALCLFVGNFVLVYSCVIGCAIKGCGRVAAYTPLMVLYWIYMSFAAWRGSLQLISNPHFWEKTEHHEQQ